MLGAFNKMAEHEALDALSHMVIPTQQYSDPFVKNPETRGSCTSRKCNQPHRNQYENLCPSSSKDPTLPAHRVPCGPNFEEIPKSQRFPGVGEREY